MLNSPPLTWISHVVAFRNGTIPGSSRWIRAPSARKSRAPFAGISRILSIPSNAMRALGFVSEGRRSESYFSSNDTVTVMTIGTGSPLSSVGVNCHWRTASIAA